MLCIKTKKGDGLSLNVIVLAVLALLVLVILAIIVLRGAGNFNSGVNSCDGGCVYDKSDCKTGYVAVPSSCSVAGGQAGKYCCTNINGN